MRKSLVGLVAASVLVLGTSVLNANIGFVSVDNKVTLVNPTTAIVTGSVQCTLGEDVSVFANVIQQQSGGAISQGEFSGVCTGFLQTFVVSTQVLVPVDGNLKKGPATVLVSVSTDDGAGGFDSQIVTQKGHVGR